jgi:hypothetical protein
MALAVPLGAEDATGFSRCGAQTFAIVDIPAPKFMSF